MLLLLIVIDIFFKGIADFTKHYNAHLLSLPSSLRFACDKEIIDHQKQGFNIHTTPKYIIGCNTDYIHKFFYSFEAVLYDILNPLPNHVLFH